MQLVRSSKDYRSDPHRTDVRTIFTNTQEKSLLISLMMSRSRLIVVLVAKAINVTTLLYITTF